MNGKVGQECSVNIIYLIVLGPIKQLLLSLITLGPIKNNYRWVWLLCSHLEQLSSPQTWKLCHNLSALCKNRKQLMIHDGALTQYTSGASLPDCFSLAFDNISSNFGKCSQQISKPMLQLVYKPIHLNWIPQILAKGISGNSKAIFSLNLQNNCIHCMKAKLANSGNVSASVPISSDMFVSDCDQIFYFCHHFISK